MFPVSFFGANEIDSLSYATNAARTVPVWCRDYQFETSGRYGWLLTDYPPLGLSIYLPITYSKKRPPFGSGFGFSGDDYGGSYPILGIQAQGARRQFPKWESLKINPKKVACFSSPISDQ